MVLFVNMYCFADDVVAYHKKEQHTGGKNYERKYKADWEYTNASFRKYKYLMPVAVLRIVRYWECLVKQWKKENWFRVMY